MKKILFILSMAAFATMNFAQEISNDQWVLVSKRSADWCSFCGQYGWDMMDGLVERANAENRVFPVALHHSGGLKTQVSEDLTDNLGGFSQPLFFLNEDDLDVGSGNVNAKLDEVFETAEFLTGFTAFAGVGLEGSIVDGESIDFTATVRMFETLSTEMYLGMYLIQNNLVAFQQSQGNDAEHKNMLTHSFFENSFGERIGEGSLENGSEFSFSGSVDLEDGMVSFEDMSVLAVIWNKDSSGKYRVFNLGVFSNLAILLSNTTIENTDITFDTKVISDQLVISLEADMSDLQAQVNIVNSAGQLIREISISDASTSVDVSTWATGIYYVQLETNKGQATSTIRIAR